MRAALALCDVKRAFLFQARPDLFPEGRLTDLECELWANYFDDKKASNP